jgi:hypothetical protein
MTKHRTSDWARLSESTLFDIEDRPGLIVVRQAARDMRQVKRVLWGFWAFVLLFPLLFGLAAWIVSMFTLGLFAAWFTRNVLRGLKAQPLEVRFLADRLEFYQLGGKRQAVLHRDGMQQISVQENNRRAFGSQFMSDIGWIMAFTDPSKTRAILKNNLLMAAYRQPVHLDAMGRAAAPRRVGRAA